jgi:hypothetical protein
MAAGNDITSFVTLSSIVSGASMDTYADFGSVERSYSHWAARGIKKLTRETLKSGKRYMILTVNRNLNTATLPCDFKEELFVGIIDPVCGEKIPLTLNPNIVNTHHIETIPCDIECEAKCKSCYNKQMCNDLSTTQVINKILINDVYYDETVTSTLLPSGEYFVVKTTPVFNTRTQVVDYITKKEYVTTFDVADCGCVKITEENNCKLKDHCWDIYCCYCTQCKRDCHYIGGYRIFPETSTIQFDVPMKFDKVYIEYRGFLPKKGNEYIVPEAAYEALVNFVKFKSVENKKGVSLAERQWYWMQYTRERDNMVKVLGRMGLQKILESALRTPKFEYTA